jgi:hypothetical protein
LGHQPASSQWPRVVVRCFGIGVGQSTGLGDVVRYGGKMDSTRLCVWWQNGYK